MLVLILFIYFQGWLYFKIVLCDFLIKVKRTIQWVKSILNPDLNSSNLSLCNIFRSVQSLHLGSEYSLLDLSFDNLKLCLNFPNWKMIKTMALKCSFKKKSLFLQSYLKLNNLNVTLQFFIFIIKIQLIIDILAPRHHMNLYI